MQLLAAPGTLGSAVDAWFARTLAPRSAAALRHGVAAMRMALQSHVRTVLPEVERLYLNDLMRTHDAVEGIAAFMASVTDVDGRYDDSSVDSNATKQ